MPDQESSKPRDRAGRDRMESAGDNSPATVTSEALFAGRRRLLIQHGDEYYVLKITNNEKLSLTK